jgi:hypothetical protein
VQLKKHKNIKGAVMKKKNHLTHFKLSVIALSVISLGIIISTIYIPWVFNLEIATTLLAAFMSIGCLMHIYKEHQKWVLAECSLSEEIVKKLYSEYTHLPAREDISALLNKTLALQSSPEHRLNTLKNLNCNKNIQLAFVIEAQEIKAEQEVLEALGLNWQTSSNAKHFDMQA